jgi:hypothetical protein
MRAKRRGPSIAPSEAAARSGLRRSNNTLAWENRRAFLNVEIFWAASGTRQLFTEVTKNQFLEVWEDSKEVKRLERQTVPFHRAASEAAGPQPRQPSESSKVR